MGMMITIGILIFVAVIAFTVIPLIIAQQQRRVSSNQLDITLTAVSIARFTLTPVNTPTPLPTLTPTPSFAQAVLSFGEAGIGQGMFDDARYIAVDGDGSIYVADYQGGRVQRFDSSGKYQSQWRVGDSQTFISGMSANHAGDVYVAYDTVIGRYNGKTGKLISTLQSPNGGEFGDLYATADGHLAAMWYEGRYGLITSLEGHRDDLVIFDADDQIVRTIPAFISGQTDSLALDTYLAVDGSGTIYALSDSVLFQFSPEGKYINRLNGSGDQPGQYGVPSAFMVDGQRRLYFSDGEQIHVYSPDWRYLDTFPTGVFVDMLAIDEQGALWGVSRDKVTKFILRGK
jgi:streptogramin lyase